MTQPLDMRDAALLAIAEAAPLCTHPIERHALTWAQREFDRGDYAEAIREAINAAYVAGMGREKFDRNRSQGNRKRNDKAEQYRREVAALARLPRIPAGTYDALAAKHFKKPASIKREVARIRAAARRVSK